MSTTNETTTERPAPPAEPEFQREGVGRRIVGFFSGGIPQIVLLLVALFWLIPGVGLLVASLRPESANNTGWWTAFAHPDQFTTHNYTQLLKNNTMISAFTNTVIITVSTTILVVVIGSMAGYAFAWMEFPGRDWIFLIVVGLLAVPLQVALIPIAKFYNLVGLFHTLPAVILFHLGFGLPFAVFLLRNFFAGIPRDLLEAARMDGATEVRIFIRVILPLGLPAIASLGIFQFLWTWNDLLVGLTFGGSSARPLTVAIKEQFAAFGNNIDVISSASFLSMIVPLVVFFSFQRYFVQGVLAGSVK
ncbi:MAG: sugar ABC transporter permease [Pseudonocardiales bacterium]|nr:MAG: sugar ABC transporter permease [Pseudonocardiales bacterium]